MQGSPFLNLCRFWKDQRATPQKSSAGPAQSGDSLVRESAAESLDPSTLRYHGHCQDKLFGDHRKMVAELEAAS